MKELAKLIRKGLATGAEPDGATRGIEVDGGVYADVIGLALIGKLGLEEALFVVEVARTERRTGDDGPMMQRVFQELGISREEALALKKAHYDGRDILDIVEKLERNKFIFKPA